MSHEDATAFGRRLAATDATPVALAGTATAGVVMVLISPIAGYVLWAAVGAFVGAIVLASREHGEGSP